MGIDLEEAIKYSKDILLNSNFFDKVSFSRYSKVFFAASENIRAYLDQERFNKSRALTVLSGGDHVFNLISHGVKEIDAFDINYLTYFVYKLRLAMIRGLSYQDFIQANYDFSFSGHLNNCDNMINFLKRYLDEDVYGYYKKMIEFSRSADIPLPILYYMPRTC